MGIRQAMVRDVRVGMQVYKCDKEPLGYVYSFKPELCTGTICRLDGTQGTGDPISDAPYVGKCGWQFVFKNLPEQLISEVFIDEDDIIKSKPSNLGGIMLKSEKGKEIKTEDATGDIKKINAFELEIKRTMIGFDLTLKSEAIENIVAGYSEDGDNNTILYFANNKEKRDEDKVSVLSESITNSELRSSVRNIKRLGENIYEFSGDNFIYRNKDKTINFGFIATIGIKDGITIHHKSLLMDKNKLKALAEDIKHVLGTLFSNQYENVIIKTKVTSYIEEF